MLFKGCMDGHFDSATQYEAVEDLGRSDMLSKIDMVL